MSNTGTKTVVAVSLATLLAGASYYVYRKGRKERIPTKWEEAGILKKLNIYPLKSGHRIELTKADCTSFGLKQSHEEEKAFQLRDRGLVVYSERDNEFRTARTYPKMVLIDVGVHDEGNLVIDAPTMRSLFVQIPNSNTNKEFKVILHNREEVYGIDCGDEAASWFSRYILEKPSGLRLAYHDGSKRRDITKTHKKLLDYYINLGNNSTGLYCDLSSVLLINQQSVYDLSKRIGPSSTVTVDNFRPNLVIDGTEITPYAEDEWDWIKVGDVVFRNVKECTRCVMTTVNPETGTLSSDREPLKTLETYRKSNGPDKTPVMGVNLEVRKPGTIHAGAKVYFAKNGN